MALIPIGAGLMDGGTTAETVGLAFGALTVVVCTVMFARTALTGRTPMYTNDLAKIAIKNHHNGTLAPNSALKREITLEDYQKARIISWPFGLYDCAAQTDGAAAAVITRADLARSFRWRGRPRASSRTAGRRWGGGPPGRPRR